ncbi:MAG: hypothetical protein WEB58_13540 [Planctomycetaceae bacterium]
MRKLYFDQFEFDSSSSEESLEIHVALKQLQPQKQFDDLQSFAHASAGESASVNLGKLVPYQDLAGFSSIREYLKRFANINVPDPCDWQMVVLNEDDLYWDGILDSPDYFIRYQWSSTA